jgi:DNA polymerase III gamma/tau subunit
MDLKTLNQLIKEELDALMQEDEDMAPEEMEDHEESHEELMDELKDFYEKLKSHFDSDEEELDVEEIEDDETDETDEEISDEEIEEMLQEVDSSDIEQDIADRMGVTLEKLNSLVDESYADWDEIEKIYMGDTHTDGEKISLINDLVKFNNTEEVSETLNESVNRFKKLANIRG